MSNSLAAMRPELVREWSDKNLPLTPDMINEKSRKNVWWKCRECGNEWKSVVYARIKGTVCPVCADHALLMYKQSPQASQVKEFDDWTSEGVKVNKGSKTFIM